MNKFKSKSFRKHITQVLAAILSLALMLSLAVLPAVAETSGDYTYRILDNGTVEITGYSGSDTELVIPSEIEGLAVSSIGNGAFESCISIISVFISSNVKNIGHYAFNKCTNLRSATIPSSIPNIKEGTFGDCSSLTSITIPNSVKSISMGAFSDCISLRSIFIPESVTYISPYAFTGCDNLLDINISENNTEYSSSERVLYSKDMSKLIWCPNIFTDYFVSNNVKSIMTGAFHHCTKLSRITLPNSITMIDSLAFVGCSNLTTINIPDSVIHIGTLAFKDCINLTNIYVTNENQIYSSFDGVLYNKVKSKLIYCPQGIKEYSIPSTVTTIEQYAFDDCTFLTNISIPNSVTTIGSYAFAGCTSLKSVKIPNSVTSIENGTFSNCTSLINIIVPDNITSIGDWAFNDCTSLTSIAIPESVTSIGYEALGYYHNYDQVLNYIYNKKSDNFTISGYAGTAAEEYANDNGFEFIALEPVTVPGDVNGDGEVTLTDSINIQKAALSMKELSEQALKNADLNGDGKISVIDAIIAQKIALKMIV